MSGTVCRVWQFMSSHSNRETSPPRAAPHETHTVALEKQLEGSRITGKGYTSSQVAPPSLKMVAGGKQCASRSTITPTKTYSADLYRRIKRRVGCSLKRTHSKGNLVPSRKQVTHKPSGTKGGLSGPKRVPRPLFEQLPMQPNHTDCTGVAKPSKPQDLPKLVTKPFNQTLHRNLTNLNLHAWLPQPQQSRSMASLRQWQHELWLLKGDQPDPSMRQNGPFLQSGALVIRWTSGHHL